ncbi:MAG: HAD hydrolase-like protein [Chlamydiales bacterium]|nr:HAD hydrolase-like protein [Chlamydiales bacterium]
MLVIFDLDDTLVDTSGVILPIKLEQVMDAMIREGLVLKNKQGALTELLTINAGAKNSRSAIQEFLELNEIDMIFFPIAIRELEKSDLAEIKIEVDGANEMLQRISSEHSIGLVTAGEKQYQLLKLRLAQISEQLFSRIIVCKSEEKGKYYQEFLKDFQYHPKDIVVCGDRIQQDLSPAKILGMNTIHIKQGRGVLQSTHHMDVDYTIFSLSELVDVLKIIQNKNDLGNI